MKIQQIAFMNYREQDGAFWGDFMFRFNHKGVCHVFDARQLDEAHNPETELPLIAQFSIQETDPLVPHFNAVAFGTEYYREGDEFPLLYANIYNNYQKQETNRHEGTCCVYRLERTDLNFRMTLVQILKIGFTDDRVLWRSAEGTEDVRPYGNFVIDREKNLLHVFTMRDADHTARYFTFALPKLSDGTLSKEFGVPVVTLEKEDILSLFDTDYHLYIQGACCHKGLIYSSEGFNEKRPPALRVIDPAAKKQILHVDLVSLGFPGEAEWIDFRGDVCYYSDGFGKIFRVDFEL